MTKKLLLFIPAILIIAATALYVFANYKVKTVVDTRIVDMIANGDYLALDYDSVAIQLNGDIVMSNLHVVDKDSNEYVLVDIRITDYDYFNSTPGHMNLSTRGIRFPAQLPVFGNAPGNSLNNYLSSVLVEDTLAVELNYQYEYYPEDEARLLNVFRINLPGSFTLSSQWLMKNVPIAALNQNPSGAPGDTSNITLLFQNADIPNASMALQDLGVVNAMLSLQGNAMGMSAEQYRQQLLAQLQTAALFVPQQLQSLAQDFLGNFSEFLEGEKTFRISITPEYGGNIQQLQGEIMGAFYIGDMSRITELLQLDIETIQAN